MARRSFFWEAAAFLLLPTISYSLTLKGIDEEYIYQNDIMPGPNIGKEKKVLMEEIKISICGKNCFDTTDIIQRTSKALLKDGKDPYFIKSLEFTIPVSVLNGLRDISITLRDGKLFGMSDFKALSEPKVLEKGLSDLWFVWNHLRVTYKVIIDRGELKVEGEVDLKYEDLVMHVKFRPSNPESSTIEMSKVHRVKIKLMGFRMDQDMESIISEEIRQRTEIVLNSDMRETLLRYMRMSLIETPGFPELPSSELVPSYDFIMTR